MTPGAELIREIVDRNRDDFRPGKEGYLFIGKEELGTRYFTLRCLMMIDYFIKTFQQYVEHAMNEEKSDSFLMRSYPVVLSRLKTHLEKARNEDKSDARLRYNGFYACATSVPGYIPFYNNANIPMVSPSQLLQLFFQRIFGDLEESLHLKEIVLAFRQIIPFANTCDAKIKLIDRTFDAVLDNIRQKHFVGQSDEPVAWGLKIDIRNNDVLQSMESIIEKIIHAKLRAMPAVYEYVPALSKEALHIEMRLSVMFHVTVLGDQAFLGYYVDPEKTNYYRFNYTHEDMMNFYNDTYAEEMEAEEFE